MPWFIIGYVSVLAGMVGYTHSNGDPSAALPVFLIFICGACAGAFITHLERGRS